MRVPAHSVLGVVADLVALPGATVDRRWLDLFGEQLTDDETLMLTRAASAGQRVNGLNHWIAAARHEHTSNRDDDEGPEGSEEPTFQSNPLVRLADTYRDTLLDLANRLAQLSTGETSS